MMTATFGRELIGLSVVDSRGDVLGTVADLMLDLNTGSVGTLIIELNDNLDASLLPWPSEAGLMLLPTEEIERVGTQIVLNR
ncbi:MAG TPA: PRC-barrel domain-containing protein [Candidatus Thalassarchaeaceae archaeon]|jgi:sporulation protein YlmC with PRC-barrel domain|nr:PRC-barrel domain-containing protein [Candidatus Thalassarchaeaceae archaeon]HJM19124.1 PRC-barrel domain-containing protein [Candidatus Thalassarchaeaceae archaeon]HJM87412.1 PRC-barrel domain-containing protein [Candidatus Thalassarchaeaceae archaeon]